MKNASVQLSGNFYFDPAVVPIMLLKVVGIKIPESLSVIIILAITVFAIAVSVMNCKKLYLKLKDQA